MCCIKTQNTEKKLLFLGEKNSVWVLTKKNMILLNCTPNFLLFPFFQLFSTKNAENYYFDQCLGLRSTQTLVEIYNILLSLTQSQTLFLALLAAELKAVCSDNNCIFLLCSLLLRIYFLVVWIKGKLSKSDQMRLLTGTSWEGLLPGRDENVSKMAVDSVDSVDGRHQPVENVRMVDVDH